MEKDKRIHHENTQISSLIPNNSSKKFSCIVCHLDANIGMVRNPFYFVYNSDIFSFETSLGVLDSLGTHFGTPGAALGHLGGALGTS